MPDEQFFLRLPEIASLPLTPFTQLEQVGEPKFKLDDRAIGQAYAAWLGFYKSWLKPLRWTPAELVNQGAVWARCLGWQGFTEPSGHPGTSRGGRAQGGSGDRHEVLSWTPPPIAKRTVGMMGLRGTPGLNVVDRLDEGGDDVDRNARGGARGHGRGRGQSQQQGARGNKTGDKGRTKEKVGEESRRQGKAWGY